MLKLSFTRTSLSIICRHPIFHRPISCSKVSCLPASPTPQTPLFLRPSIFKATVQDFQKWHLWAKNLATSVGSTFMDLDNGPDATLLHRELDWLIQDAIELNYENASEVSLRACLDDLYKLWNQRVEGRRPFQYVVGCEHWRDLVLSVEEGVLIPRPETELIVDFVESVVEKNGELRDGLWADLGTGSGALAIGIGRILSDSGRVVAVDLSPVAVSVASYNVQRYNLQDKIAVKKGSWFEPLKNCQLTGLVSNPPYIPSEDISGLQAEVARHEPRLALDGGADGMKDLLHLCNGAASMLKPGGFFAFETNGDQQSRSLVEYLETERQSGFCDVEIASDFAGIQRFVTGYKAR